jgi:tRNA threonylcarbamoyladenosine biosynthesis protein TsaE
VKGLFEIPDVEAMWALARAFARDLRPGDVVCLEGDLGAGKTTFTQGLAAALGVPGRVTSPTFCIVQEHASETRLLVHMDLYRLSGEEDVEAIGWEDYRARGAILVVEWPERAGSLVPPDARRLVFRYGASEESRTVCVG